MLTGRITGEQEQEIFNLYMYQKLAEKIETSGVVIFSKANAVSDFWIEKAEKALDLSLPPSYKWWLKTYGGARVGGDDIYTILQEDFEDAVGPDIVYQAIVNEKRGVASKERLYICETENDESWFFDTSENDNGEYKVYLQDFVSQQSNIYADSFEEFMIKKIDECLNIKSPLAAASKWINKHKNKKAKLKS